MPGDLIPSATAHLGPGAREWFDLILVWGCLEVADDNLREMLLLANGRGEIVIPTVPITSLPR